MNTTIIGQATAIITDHIKKGASPGYIAEQLGIAGLLSEPGEHLETLRSLCHIATTNGIGLTETVDAYLALTKETS